MVHRGARRLALAQQVNQSVQRHSVQHQQGVLRLPQGIGHAACRQGRERGRQGQALGQQQVGQHHGALFGLGRGNGGLQCRHISLGGLVQRGAVHQGMRVVGQCVHTKACIHLGLALAALRGVDLVARTAQALGGDLENRRLGLAQRLRHKAVGFFLLFGVDGLGDLHQDELAIAAVFGVLCHYRMRCSTGASEEV